MGYFLIHLSSSVHWQIFETDPDYWDIPDISVRILNPKYVNNIPSNFSSSRNLDIIMESVAFYEQDRIIIEYPNPLTVSHEEMFAIIDKFFNLLSRIILRKKRFNNIGLSYITISTGKESLDDYIISKKSLVTDRLLTRSYFLDRAICFNDFIETQSEESSIHSDIYLNSIKSYDSGDYRNTILYCGIACEVAVSIKCDSIYDLALSNFYTTPDINFKIVQFKTSKGESLKDPIYVYLRDKLSFDQKIQQLTLYAMGRSLLLDDEILYQQIKKLYTTRNKIAHLGEVVPKDSVIPVDRKGAAEALHRTREFFEWLSLDSDYSLPDTNGNWKFTSIENGVQRGLQF